MRLAQQEETRPVERRGRHSERLGGRREIGQPAVGHGALECRPPGSHSDMSIESVCPDVNQGQSIAEPSERYRCPVGEQESQGQEGDSRQVGSEREWTPALVRLHADRPATNDLASPPHGGSSWPVSVSRVGVGMARARSLRYLYASGHPLLAARARDWI